MTLRKKGGGVRGIVAGEVIRRLTARIVAQQLDPAENAATAPHQYALSTRAGCECVAHALQVLAELDPEMTTRRSTGSVHTIRCPGGRCSKDCRWFLEEALCSRSFGCSTPQHQVISGKMTRGQ